MPGTKSQSAETHKRNHRPICLSAAQLEALDELIEAALASGLVPELAERRPNRAGGFAFRRSIELAQRALELGAL